jgi:hypothetical protein
MTYGGICGEELADHLCRPQWLTAREQTFTGHEPRLPVITVIRHPSPLSVTPYLPYYQTFSQQ